MRISVLGSGSSGNCTYIETEKTSLVVDAGFGRRSFARRLCDAGLRPSRIDAVLVTHGHSDHVKGIPQLFHDYNPVVFLTEGTREEAYCLAEMERFETFRAGEQLTIGDLCIETFPVPHDALEPVGFVLRQNGLRGLIATDLGHLPPHVVERTRGCDWIILESNHDIDLLKIGPYPWELKRRVLGPWGHLSNAELADFLEDDFDCRAVHLWLAHLSRKNNLPELALETARRALARRRHAAGSRPRIHLTDQTCPSIVVDL